MTRFDTETLPNRPQMLTPKTKRPYRSVEQILNEIAYVLHLTEMVKAEIITESEMTELRRRAPSNELCV